MFSTPTHYDRETIEMKPVYYHSNILTFQKLEPENVQCSKAVIGTTYSITGLNNVNVNHFTTTKTKWAELPNIHIITILLLNSNIKYGNDVEISKTTVLKQLLQTI